MMIRKADFAGSWYPRQAAACEAEIQQFLVDESIATATLGICQGAIVPHAGWYFSGSIACNTIRSLQDGVAPDAIAVFGMHLYPEAPCYLMVEGAWETPFGALRVAEPLARSLAERFTFQLETPRDYHPDNTIELQLPFIRYFFGDVAILPMGLPPHSRVLDIAAGLVEIAEKAGMVLKFVGSTDLTHYGFNYGFSPKGTGPQAVDWVRKENDRRIIDHMLALAPERVIDEAVRQQNACCAGAAAAAIRGAQLSGAVRAELLAYATSYDKSPGDSLVGYAGILLGKDRER